MSRLHRAWNDPCKSQDLFDSFEEKFAWQDRKSLKIKNLKDSKLMHGNWCRWVWLQLWGLCSRPQQLLWDLGKSQLKDTHPLMTSNSSIQVLMPSLPCQSSFLASIVMRMWSPSSRELFWLFIQHGFLSATIFWKRMNWKYSRILVCLRHIICCCSWCCNALSGASFKWQLSWKITKFCRCLSRI